MKYTQGQWTAYRDPLTQHAWHIDVQHTPHDKQYTEVGVAYNEADARLMTAAPALYEALVAAKAMCIFWEKKALPGCICYSTEMDQINAALALAEGKEAKRA